MIASVEEDRSSCMRDCTWSSVCELTKVGLSFRLSESNRARTIERRRRLLSGEYPIESAAFSEMPDRRVDLAEWAEILGKVLKRKIHIYAYANNYFAGCGPGAIEQFRDLWRRHVATGKSNRAAAQRQLFK